MELTVTMSDMDIVHTVEDKNMNMVPRSRWCGLHI